LSLSFATLACNLEKLLLLLQVLLLLMLTEFDGRAHWNDAHAASSVRQINSFIMATSSREVFNLLHHVTLLWSLD
jgi:hypothetical protein